MDIQEFSNSIITTPEEGKSIINVLMGLSPSGPNVLDALIGLYESYPEHIKSNKKVFGPTFVKMFTKYEMQEKHLPYYRDFSKVWSSADLATIKVKYASLLKNEEKQGFKNSREFAKALSAIDRYDHPELAFEFIENNLRILSTFVKKGANKFIDNLSEFGCWEPLIHNDYEKFKQICNNLTINFVDVLKKEYVSSYYGFKYLIQNSSENNIISLFKDIKKEANFFDGGAFFSNRHDKVRQGKAEQINVFETLIQLLIDNKHHAFAYFINAYQQQIDYCMDAYLLQENPVSVLNQKDWENVIARMIKVSERYMNKEFFSSHEIETLKEKIDNNFGIINKIILDNELPANQDNKTKKLKI